MAKKKVVTEEDYVIQVEEAPVTELAEHPPMPHESGWTDYVLSHLADDEKIEGNPTTDGLRRIAEKLIGDIVESQVEAIRVEPRWSTIKHTLVFQTAEGIRKFSEIADVHGDNTDELYLRYASATASTRAEGRALRKALKLRRVLAAEEVLSGQPTANMVAHVAMPDPNKMNAMQANMLNAMFARANINGWKYILEVLSFIAPTEQYERLNDIPREHVAVICEHVQKYQQINPETGKPHEVPPSLQGYTSDFLTKWTGVL